MNIEIVLDEKYINKIRDKIDYNFLMKIREEIKEEIMYNIKNRDIKLLVQEEVKAQLKGLK